MAYLDEITQGIHNTYGSYSQVYRKPRYTMIGQTRVSSPRRISLDTMYGGIQRPSGALPTLKPPPTYTIPRPEEALPEIGARPDMEQYLQQQGWARQREPETGTWRTLPGQAEEGQIYEDSAGTRWIHRGGEWKTTSEWYTGSEDLDEWLQGNPKNLYQKYMEVLAEFNPDEARDLNYEEFLQRFLNKDLPEISPLIDPFLARINDITNENVRQAITDELKLRGITPEGAEYRPDIENWQQQLGDLMGSMDIGEIDIVNEETGEINLDALRSSDNIMSNWLADTIENSYQTGRIMSDIITRNEETGEWELAPELQTMNEYIGAQNEEVQEQYRDFNKQLALHAISQGHSVESGFYSEYIAQNIVNQAADTTNTLSTVMMQEVESQYNYMANSFKNLLVEAGRTQEAEAFANQMKTAYEGLRESFVEQIQQISAQMAEIEAARRGNIFTGLLSGILNIGLLMFPKGV